MERGAGNPLFLQKLASVGEQADEAEELPETVEALVATRIDQLGPGDRALLRWASVLGVSFSGSLIVDVLEERSPGESGSLRSLDRLGEFVERDPDVAGAFRFRHALIRDAAYEGLSYRRRRELHGRVAEVIEQRLAERPEDAAELLSLHYFNAGRWPEAWRYSRAAGDSAREVYANVDAARFYERAIETSTHLKTLGEGRAGTHVALARRGARSSRRLPRRHRRSQVCGSAVQGRPCCRPRRSTKHEPSRGPDSAPTRTALRDTTVGLEGKSHRSTAPDATRAACNLLALRAQIHIQQGRPRDAIAIATEVVRVLAEPLGPSRALARAYSALDGGFSTRRAREGCPRSEGARDLPRGRRSALGSGDRVEPRGTGLRRGALEGGDELLHALAGRARTPRRLDPGGLGRCESRRGPDQPRPLDEAGAVLEEARDPFVRPAGDGLDLRRDAVGAARADPGRRRLRDRQPHRSPRRSSLGRDRLVRPRSCDLSRGSACAARRRTPCARGPWRRGAHARTRVIAARGPPRSGTRDCFRQTGDFESASEQLDLALHIARRQRLLYEEAQTLRELVDLAAAEGRTEEAHEALVAAERLDQRLSTMS